MSLPEQTFHLTLHSRDNHSTTPFEVLLGFCKLLQAAVSKPDLHSTHTHGITNAKGSHRNSCYSLRTVCTVRKGGVTFTTCKSSAHFSLNNCSFVKTVHPVGQQDHPKGGGTDSHPMCTTNPSSVLPDKRSYGVGNPSARPNNHDIACVATQTQCGPVFSEGCLPLSHQVPLYT